jgi:hypothetical protein
MAKTPVIDQWLLNADGSPDPFAGTVDFGMTKADELDPDLLLDEHPVLQPEIITGPPAPSDEEVETPPASVVPVEPAPEPEGPEVFDVGEGATITRTREKGQWKAVLDPGTGANPEVFWGKNKDELLVNALKGKLEATKKIRELNKKVKLTAAAPPKPVQQVPQPAVRQLTADETFEIKTLWESDPAAAFDMLIKKRTNTTLEELVGKAQRGDQASMSLETEAISREFANRNPDYYADPEYHNFSELVKWLAKFKLNKIANDGNSQEIFQEIWATGNYTVENLEEAFEDLTEDGKLVKPRLPKPPPPVEVPSVTPAPQPAPATSAPRIVKTETRPRAALGIQASDITPVAQPQNPTAPTDEDLENMSDSQLSELLRASLRFKAKARRS